MYFFLCFLFSPSPFFVVVTFTLLLFSLAQIPQSYSLRIEIFSFPSIWFFFLFGILDLSLRLPYGDKSSGQVQSELKDPVTAGVCPAYFLCLPDGVFGFLVAYSDPLSCV